MADCTLILTGSMASVFCKGLLETGKFIRVLTAPDKQPSGLYEAFGNSRDARPRKVESRYARGVIAGTTPENSKKKGSKDDKSNKGKGKGKGKDDTLHRDSDMDTLNAEYVVRGSEQSASVVIAIAAKCPTAFRVEVRDEEQTALHCAGTSEETLAVLSEIQQALT